MRHSGARDDLTANPHLLTARPVNRRHRCHLVALLNAGYADPEMNLTAGRQEPPCESRDELVLRIDEMTTTARQLAVLKHERLSLDTELADVVRAPVSQDRFRPGRTACWAARSCGRSRMLAGRPGGAAR
jgi:hypothetical protein